MNPVKEMKLASNGLTKLPQIDPDILTGETLLPETNEIDWKGFLVTDEPADEQSLIMINNVSVCTSGNHSLVLGKKKSRKTLFICLLTGLYDGKRNADILICDTEQGKKHVWKSRERIYQLTGEYINVLALRGISAEERKKVIEAAVIDGKYKLLVIDGIRDLLSNINDPDQCTNLVTWIEHMTVTYGLHIVNVLHLNKVDNNARGHIGSELLNKAETTIELELDPKAGCTMVKCESSRDIPFESFAFTHDQDGLPELVSVPTKGVALSEKETKERLKYVFEGGALKYNEVTDGIKSHFEVGINKASQLLATFVRSNWVIKSGKDRSPDTVYKIM